MIGLTNAQREQLTRGLIHGPTHRGSDDELEVILGLVRRGLMVLEPVVFEGEHGHMAVTNTEGERALRIDAAARGLQ